MQVLLGRRARAEALQAQSYYGEISPPLGADFARRLDECLARVADQPLAWPPYLGATRRCLLTQFAHAVVYRVMANHVQVIAVVHQSRRPGYWRAR